ncbi:MAG: nucleotidyltransferase family protein [Bdellovibrionales bacterium]|nr:nucleotidyltransferase family protein [Bdellovibrionales bacterium]
MNRWSNTTIPPTATIKNALLVIDQTGYQIALVVDDHGKLIGTVTDGDIRRAILKGLPLDTCVKDIMNKHPITISVKKSRHDILKLMRDKVVKHIPLIDSKGVLVGIETLDDVLKPLNKPNAVILMAGGKGERLYPLTKDCPKPLLKVGSKPILEITLENLATYGFNKFYLSVNYKAEMVENHFGDGHQWNVHIEYLKEDTSLGTAGSLGFIKDTLHEPFIVMNADLITKVNYDYLLQFHEQSNAHATMCVRKFTYQVPFGMVSLDENQIVNIIEKPTQSFLVSGGIYVFEPDVLKFIERNEKLDMPQLFERLIEQKKKTVAFPVTEYWIDIGRTDDYKRAIVEAEEILD